jgi:hypothetical protein
VRLVVGGHEPTLGEELSGDADLLPSTVYLLRARVLGVAAGADRDREVVARAIEDVRAFAPQDSVAAQVVARMAHARASPKIDDLRP